MLSTTSSLNSNNTYNNGKQNGTVEDDKMEIEDNECGGDGDSDPTKLISLHHKKSKWFFTPKDLSLTPSIRRGMSIEDETILRRIGINLICRIHSKLVEPYCRNGINFSHPPARTVCSASVFFHRFYMIHPFQIFHPYEISTTCYFLACKTEEKPKPCEDVIRITQFILGTVKTDTVFDFSSNVDKIKKEICTLENVLMQTLNFEHIVEHPFTSHIEKCIGCFNSSSTEVLIKLRRRLNYYFEESLTSTICVQWNACTIAITFMILACNKEKVPLREWDTLISEPEFYQFDDYNICRETVRKIGDTLMANIASKNQTCDLKTCINIMSRNCSD